METNNLNQDNEMNRSTIELTKESIFYYDQIRKWTTFFSILGFVFIGLMSIFGIFAGSIFSKFGQVNPGFSYFFGFVYLIFAVIYFFPVLYLYRFSVSSGRAIKNRDSNEIVKAFKNLKSHYQFIGILVIILLALYLFMGVGFLVVKLLK